MIRPFTHENKPLNINKAKEIKQLQLKISDNNKSKIKNQPDMSNERWKNSMEQIRKIAKKSQDSSQVIDNLFTENDIDRSDMDVETPNNRPRSFLGDSKSYCPISSGRFGSYRPISQYANRSSNFFNRNCEFDHRTTNTNDFMNVNNNMKAFHSLPNMNQSNANSGNYPPWSKYDCTDYRLMNPWNIGINQSNITSFPPCNNYNPSFNRPNNFYSQNPYTNFMSRNPNFCVPPISFNPYINQYQPFQFPNSEVNGIESMKKYVNSLLDKLELLNDTVSRLKSDNLNRSRKIEGCPHSYDMSSPISSRYHNNHASTTPSYCCSHKCSVQQTAKSCSCCDLRPPIYRRPPSSISENHGYISNYKNTETHFHPENLHQNCKTTNDRLQMTPRTYNEPLPLRPRQICKDCNHQSSYAYHKHGNSCLIPKDPNLFISKNGETPSEASLVVNSNNNNDRMNVLVDSSYKSSSELMSHAELTNDAIM